MREHRGAVAVVGHLERGHNKLRNEALEAQRRLRGEDARVRPTWNSGINAAAERARRAELAKTRAEFEELAAGAAPEAREMLERMAAQYRDLEAKARECASATGGNERARDNVDCLVQWRGTESVRALQLRELLDGGEVS